MIKREVVGEGCLGESSLKDGVLTIRFNKCGYHEIGIPLRIHRDTRVRVVLEVLERPIQIRKARKPA